MAAGTSSRFVPLSLETPKGLLEVKGEILIERQIRQLKEAGISDITIVTGYKAEQFAYLKDRFGVNLVYNEDYARYNNISSLIRVADRLSNTFVCSSDNYFPENVFADTSECSCYSALHAQGITSEYCLTVDGNDNISKVNVGGKNDWYMVGHVYFSDDFSRQFRKLMEEEYEKDEVKHGYWEDLYMRNIDNLPKMKIRRYEPHQIEEFDSLDELRAFDTSYLDDTRSGIIKEIACRLNCGERDLHGFEKITTSGGGHEDSHGFTFMKGNEKYVCSMEDNSIKAI